MSANSKFLTGTLFLLLPLFSPAQNFQDDIAAIVQHVSAAEQYTIASTIKVYTKKGGTLQQQLDASVTANKTAALTIIGEVEMLQTGTQVIVTDRDERLIEVETLPASKQGKTKQHRQEALRLDALEQLSNSELTFKLTGTSGNVRTYSASNPKAGVRSLTIQLDVTNHKLISYTLEQSDAEGKTVQYAVVTYSTFVYTVEHPERLKTTHYVTSNGTSYQPAATFEGYTVLKK